jgi:hypothetical protein
MNTYMHEYECLGWGLNFNLFPRSWMTRSLCPLVQLLWTNLQTYTATCANIPVNRYMSSVYTKFLRWVHRPPNSYTLLFSNFLPILLEPRINRQTSLPLSEMVTNYLLDESVYNFHSRRNFLKVTPHLLICAHRKTRI